MGDPDDYEFQEPDPADFPYPQREPDTYDFEILQD
jgi:hypothetical protein